MIGNRRKDPEASPHDTAGAKGNGFTRRYKRAGYRRQSRGDAGAAFRPEAESRERRRDAILAELRRRAHRGLTRVEAGWHLGLSLPQRIAELRAEGFTILTRTERVGDARIARYVLIAERRGEP